MNPADLAIKAILGLLETATKLAQGKDDKAAIEEALMKHAEQQKALLDEIKFHGQ